MATGTKISPIYLTEDNDERPSDIIAPKVGHEGQKQEQNLACFSNLPAEIQLEIWNWAVPGPAIVKVKLCRPFSSEYDFTTDLTPNGMLLACKASRQIALKYLTTTIRLPRQPEGKVIRLRTDDTVLLYRPPWDGVPSLYESDLRVELFAALQQIKSLAIWISDLRQLSKTVEGLESIEKVVLLVHQGKALLKSKTLVFGENDSYKGDIEDNWKAICKGEEPQNKVTEYKRMAKEYRLIRAACEKKGKIVPEITIKTLCSA